MAMNRVQFQPGLSLPAFLKQFGSEAQCEAELEQARWPEGFVCPCCGGTGHSVFKTDSHKTFQCKACRRQTSLTAGTLFQSTRLIAGRTVLQKIPLNLLHKISGGIFLLLAAVAAYQAYLSYFKG